MNDFVGALIAGTTCAALFYPLEFIEATLQIGGSRQRGVLHRVSSLTKEKGMASLYRGVLPTAIGAGISGAVYFSVYASSKDSLAGSVPNLMVRQLAAGLLAGFIACFVANPFWVLKLRMISDPSQKSMFSFAQSILRTEGVGAFWKGIGPSLLGITEGAIQMVTYETLFQASSSIAFNGALSKVVAIVATYPYQFLRSQMQMTGSPYSSLQDCVYQVHQTKGFTAFYAGMGPNILRQILPSALFFSILESVKTSLSGMV